jgi:hypothetical protein
MQSFALAAYSVRKKGLGTAIRRDSFVHTPLRHGDMDGMGLRRRMSVGEVEAGCTESWGGMVLG